MSTQKPRYRSAASGLWYDTPSAAGTVDLIEIGLNQYCQIDPPINMAQKDGGPAFPDYSPATDEYHKGISTRDYFAAKALGSINIRVERSITQDEVQELSEKVAKYAFMVADAMLKERAKQ